MTAASLSLQAWVIASRNNGCHDILTALHGVLVPKQNSASSIREQESMVEVTFICEFSCVLVPDVPSKGWEHERFRWRFEAVRVRIALPGTERLF